MSAKRLGEVEVGSIVKLNENGSPVDFIVVQQGPPSDAYYGFENVTLALRKDAHSIRKFNSTANSDYENSDINKWLSDEENGYLSLLDADIRRYIHAVKIPYRPGSGGTSFNVSSGEDGLQVKAFLLSIKEIYNRSGDVPEDGSILQYFADLDPSKRACYYNGSSVGYWTRTPFIRYDSKDYVVFIHDASQNFASAAYYSYSEYGIRPAIPIPSNFRVDENGNAYIVTPSSPSSIDVTGVVIGESATITLTAATSPDSTIASYIFERQVDGGEEWMQISQTSSLTCQDPVSEDWGTVAYRACAVDDKGIAGPYITSETFEVNAGWILVSGPGENLGDKPGPFDFDFSLSVTGSTGAQAIDWSAVLDGKPWDSGSAATGETVTLSLDTRLMATGPHTLSIAASAELFVPAYKLYTFRVPETALAAGGRATQFKNSQGKALFPVTLGRLVLGPGGVDYNTLFGRQADSALQLAAGSYTGTGTSGAEAPTRLVFEFVPQVVLVTPGAAAAPALIWCGQSGGDSLTFARQGSALSWYASSAAAQLNESGTEYHYLALGRKEDAE